MQPMTVMYQDYVYNLVDLAMPFISPTQMATPRFTGISSVLHLSWKRPYGHSSPCSKVPKLILTWRLYKYRYAKTTSSRGRAMQGHPKGRTCILRSEIRKPSK